VFVPTVESHEIKDITVNAKPWTDTILTVRYTVYGPGGPDDTITVGPLVGIGRDNSDKGANKAMTQAFKYALIQVFCIADAKDDADGQTHAADAPAPPMTEAERARVDFLARVNNAPAKLRARFLEWNELQGHPKTPGKMTDEQLVKCVEWMDFAEGEAEHEAQTGGAGSPPGQAQTPASETTPTDPPTPPEGASSPSTAE
jgi:hypothetical protein